jgi:hypothetical protein
VGRQAGANARASCFALAQGVFTYSHQRAQALRKDNFVATSIHLENPY